MGTISRFNGSCTLADEIRLLEGWRVRGRGGYAACNITGYCAGIASTSIRRNVVITRKYNTLTISFWLELNVP